MVRLLRVCRMLGDAEYETRLMALHATRQLFGQVGYVHANDVL